MSLVAHHRRLLAYDDWANAESLAALRTAKRTPAASSAAARKLLAHIAGAELLWIARIQRRRSPVAVWPDLSLDECEQRLDESARLWHEVFTGLRARDLLRRVRYVNSLGERWSSTLGDIASHVVVHSAYHRGQIATILRQRGSLPPYTDFIHCVRQGFVE
jgi:uncharacterized damage-inducible protein DinB